MSRPSTSGRVRPTQPCRPSSSGTSSGFDMDETPRAGPSRSQSQEWVVHGQHFVSADGFHHIDASGGWDPSLGGMPGQMADGRIMMQMQAQAPGVMNAVPARRPSIVSAHPSHEGEDESGDFLPVDVQDFDPSAYAHSSPFHMTTGSAHHPMAYQQTPIMGPVHTSPLMTMGHPLPPSLSPTDAMHIHHAQFSTPGAGPSSTPAPAQFLRRAPDQALRPDMPHRHSAAVVGSRPAQLHRHYSLQVPPGRPSPQMIANDVFAMPPGEAPTRRAGSMGSIEPREPNPSGPFDMPGPEVNYLAQTAQGISPARALGPAPVQPHHFSPLRDDPMMTPQAGRSGYPVHVHSSATSSTTMTQTTMSATSSSTAEYAERMHRRGPVNGSSDDENDSPTKGPSASRAMRGMQLNESFPPPGVLPPKRIPMPTRPNRPAITKSAMTGGRTSAKFAKVAEDPGVEGIPPGPRSMERPGPSFACIIGQAILRSSAGGLSLEHIYRYVETAYPFFKSGDGAWRNSVRHNLSIHKMFETIPRTEKFPPGKGGIWIIHEEEKCHWPSEDKFIKNFPGSHPHHANCRQTLHERQKELEAMAKAKAEGREYVPKKGKKGRKPPTEEGSIDMIRSLSNLSDAPVLLPPSHVNMMRPAGSMLPPDVTPKMGVKVLHPPAFEVSDFEDDGDFLPIESEIQQGPEDSLEEVELEAELEAKVELEAETEAEPQTSPVELRSDPPLPRGTMVPPRFGKDRKEKRRGFEEEENVFTSKRVRVAEPLALIVPHPQETVVPDADSYVTPERERSGISTKTFASSAFKTPALVNTSSSPGSSPMPTTIGRGTHHHPSALQQAWTHDDMAQPADPIEANSSSPPPSHSSLRPTLDAAFDIKPKSINHTRRIVSDDEPFLPSFAQSPRGPPKTPLTRSSAAADRTPRPVLSKPAHTPFAKTPMWNGGSPILPLPSGGDISTPAWEMNGVLDRLRGGGMESPTRLGMGSMILGMGMGIRSPMPSTDPTRYAILLDSGSPKARGRGAAT